MAKGESRPRTPVRRRRKPKWYENLLLERECGFESRRPHHLFSASERAAAGSNRGAHRALLTAPYFGVGSMPKNADANSDGSSFHYIVYHWTVLIRINVISVLLRSTLLRS